MIAGTEFSGAIGAFDSGVGGLTVVRRIWEMLPDKQVLFVADQAHVPYGGRPLTEVAGFASGISAALVQEADARIVLMACNISTATALETVRSTNPDRVVVGVIAPGARAALQATKSFSIGVLATSGTVSIGAYSRILKSLSPDAQVIEVACPAFVPLIETEQTDSPESFDAANRYLAPILRAGADVVILGCTHYPFLLPCLRRAAPHIHFIDPAEQTVCELRYTLDSQIPNSDKQSRPTHPLYTTADRAAFAHPIHTLYTTGDTTAFAQQISFFLPEASPSFVVRQATWHGDRLRLD